MTSLLTVAKLATQAVAGYGASKIVTDIIRNNIAITTPIQRIVMGSGAFVLGSVVFEQSVNHIDRMIAEVASQIEEIKQKKEENNKTEK